MLTTSLQITITKLQCTIVKQPQPPETEYELDDIQSLAQYLMSCDVNAAVGQEVGLGVAQPVMLTKMKHHWTGLTPAPELTCLHRNWTDVKTEQLLCRYKLAFLEILLTLCGTFGWETSKCRCCHASSLCSSTSATFHTWLFVWFLITVRVSEQSRYHYLMRLVNNHSWIITESR